MSRTENLTTKLRTLSYDHERLLGMHRDAKERAANAEREMNLHKSRLASTTRTLQSTEAAHKHTTAELQRTRTALQALRQAHQAEIKRLEKDKDRMTERWAKLADAQVRLGSTSSGLRCANGEVVEASDVQLRGKGQNLLDLALEQAEQARKELFDQNRRLRGLILDAANELQSMMHIASLEQREEPALITLSTLFPMNPAEASGEKLYSLLSSVRETVKRLTEAHRLASLSTSTASASTSQPSKPRDSAELERLQKVIDTLRAELCEAQEQAKMYAKQTQELFDRYAEDERLAQQMAEPSVELITIPQRDEERERLDARFKELEEERIKFTEAAVRLGREKAALEAERIDFLEEKRAWQVQMVLADMPPTPNPTTTPPVPSAISAAEPPFEFEEPPFEEPEIPQPPQRRSPRKSKVSAIPVGKVAKKARKSRRSSAFFGPTSPKRVIPPFETEVIPPSPLPRIAAPVFVLPPPSPAAEIRQTDRLFDTLVPPSDRRQDILAPSTRASSSKDIHSAPGDASEQAPAPVPNTPSHKPFPMAKPLASVRMIHAYSPAQPSPLSRILMLANSPESPPQAGASAGNEQYGGLDASPTPIRTAHAPAAPPLRSLAAELGVSSDDDSPRPAKKPAPAVAKVKTLKPSTARLTGKEKGKARAEPPRAPRARAVAAPPEKDNVRRAKLMAAGSSAQAPAAAAPERKPVSVRTQPKPLARPKVASSLKAPPPGKGGARRVPIDSAEAAPVAPVWKG
ncbi:hypothetical protein WOLCODRAFT_140389 [Wolfiporia cocos MD-104 SS10]|uniref:Uncharacterized protein n=1 Tax=Wolfiporia cocos (strain MD-104) TaxID=742152 RepID=A0A2H3J9B5_WOLCO|nr:hypothetical protein WOLCODRAFT_140389 [Wolfiporia cocos MD-104 SS10]